MNKETVEKIEFHKRDIEILEKEIDFKKQCIAALKEVK